MIVLPQFLWCDSFFCLYRGHHKWSLNYILYVKWIYTYVNVCVFVYKCLSLLAKSKGTENQTVLYFSPLVNTQQLTFFFNSHLVVLHKNKNHQRVSVCLCGQILLCLYEKLFVQKSFYVSFVLFYPNAFNTLLCCYRTEKNFSLDFFLKKY